MVFLDTWHAWQRDTDLLPRAVGLHVPMRLTPFENQPDPLPKFPVIFRFGRPNRSEHAQDVFTAPHDQPARPRKRGRRISRPPASIVPYAAPVSSEIGFRHSTVWPHPETSP